MPTPSCSLNRTNGGGLLHTNEEEGTKFCIQASATSEQNTQKKFLFLQESKTFNLRNASDTSRCVMEKKILL